MDQTHGVDESRVAAWAAVLEARAAVSGVLEEELQTSLGLPLSWHEVLARLASASDGRMRMQDLARSVLLTKSGITRLIDRMQVAELVGRDACASDGRVVYATITEQGRATLDRALPAFKRGFERAFARHLSDEETEALRSALGRVLSGNGRETPGCPSSYLEGHPEVSVTRR
jgi:DNA-binding MarR family transcriptional regulator